MEFNCEICNKDYSCRDSLLNHRRRFHKTYIIDKSRRKTEETDCYSCKYCKKEYKIAQSRWIHEKQCKIQTETKEEITRQEVKDEITTVKEECESLRNELIQKDINHKEEVVKLKKQILVHKINKKPKNKDETCTILMLTRENERLKLELSNKNEEICCVCDMKKQPKKVKTKSIPSPLKRMIWNKYIGENVGKSRCYCCKLTEITQMSFHCGHVVSAANGGGMEVENFKPICQNCNCSMSKMNMDEFIETYKLHNDIV